MNDTPVAKKVVMIKCPHCPMPVQGPLEDHMFKHMSKAEAEKEIERRKKKAELLRQRAEEIDRELDGETPTKESPKVYRTK